MSDNGLGSFHGHIGGHQIIQTEDGSLTLKSLYFNEVCHSLNGAYAETLHNYILPNRIETFWAEKPSAELNILEVGLGLGVGVQATYDSLLNSKHENPCLNYVALELDEGLIQYAQQNTQLKAQQFPSFKELKCFKTNGLTYYQATKNRSSLTILIGNARESLPQFIQAGNCPQFNVVYQDPFSPRKNPTLWTYEWFKLLANTCSPKAQLSTYCASVSPRKAMLKANFRPQRLKGMGFKREITHAILDPEKPQDAKLEQSLLKSQAITLTDADIQEYRA